MKRANEDTNKYPNKKVCQPSLVERLWAFLQWLPGVAELTSIPSDYVLPSTQAWTRTCPDSNLRCPGCGHYLEPPVKQCVNGHAVCLKCRRQLPSCPTCREHFIRTPQPVLDRLLSTTRLPCVYAAFGCPVLEVLRRRDCHSRHCSYRPSSCPLCSWESPPRLDDRGDGISREHCLAQHMTSAHKHHVLQLDKEHVLFGWLEFKRLLTPAFLSCVITVDNQVFIFVMNYDIRRRKFFVLLKHVGSLGEKIVNSSRKEPLDRRCDSPQTQNANICESATGPETKQQRIDTSGEPPLPCAYSDNTGDFERTGQEKIFREQQNCEYIYLVELMDNKRIQSVRFVQIAMDKDDALDLAVKTGRCFNVDVALIDRLLEPGSGQFTVKLTISRSQTNVGDSIAAALKKNHQQENNLSEDSSVT